MIAAKTGLNSFTLKMIAIAAMLIDHLAWAFVETASPAGQLMHVIGRLTAPIMCYFIAEGYFHTRSLPRYMLRLAAFAVLSQIPYSLCFRGEWFQLVPMSMIVTLFLGLIALTACDRLQSRFLAVLVVIICCTIALYADWSAFGVLFVLAFGLNRGNFKMQAIWLIVTAVVMVAIMTLMSWRFGGPLYENLYILGVVLTLPLLRIYNGERGGFRGSKWIFYIFYPAHLLVIGVLNLYIL